mgnify:CR=1 FL=1
MAINEIACFQVHDALVLIADGAQFFEILEIDPTVVDRHIEKCSNCRAELEAEKQMHQLMQTMLRNVCCETAPQELHDSIHREIHNQGTQPAGYVTEFKMSQVSIEIDEFGNVTHQEIHIEGTQEFGPDDIK